MAVTWWIPSRRIGVRLPAGAQVEEEREALPAAVFRIAVVWDLSQPLDGQARRFERLEVVLQWAVDVEDRHLEPVALDGHLLFAVLEVRALDHEGRIRLARRERAGRVDRVHDRDAIAAAGLEHARG